MKIYPLPSVETKADAIILANGEYPAHLIPLSILTSSSYTVCCDGAIDKLVLSNIEPQAIVGDCDSLSVSNKERYKNIIHQINEQETNDLTKSVKFCIESGKKQIIILGATGKREDHTIANISLLADYADMVEDISMITDYGIFNAVDKFSVFETYEGQQVSLFSLTPTEITTENLKYSINNRIFTSWWQATLNEAKSSIFTVNTKGKVIIFRAFN